MAFPATAAARDGIMSSEKMKEIEDYWKKTTTALITLGSYPSVADHASALRFGRKLIDEKAVGCLLSYFFNPQGQLIQGEDDFAIQIPLELLTRVRDVIGFVPQEANVDSVISGLKSGYFKHLVINESLAS